MEEILKRLSASDGYNLDLTNLNLLELPADILQYKSTLNFLNLSGNNLSILPDWFQELTELKTIFVAGNLFEEYPSVLGKLSKLYMVSFKSNRITRISENSLR